MSRYVDRYFSGAIGRDDILLFLQNAWSPLFAGQAWPRLEWLLALSNARTGVRLRTLTDGLPVIFHNTTLQVGSDPSSICPPDPAHIERLLAQKPRAVVTCGTQALSAVMPRWRGPLLAVPHPAYRLLTDLLYEEGWRWLSDRRSARVKLAQRRGEIVTLAL